MAIEIERKYLVVNDKWKSSVESETVMKQAYLATVAKASIRVRVARDQAYLNYQERYPGHPPQ